MYSGNTLIVNGHFILDLFNQQRTTASGVSTGFSPIVRNDWLGRFRDFTSPPPDETGIEDTIISDRFSSTAAYAGRAFFAGLGTRVYFSRILPDIRAIGDLYQVNDPTSEEFSDLLDTDGGWIDIPEAAGINKLHVFGSSLLVFARNGVWRISGVDDVFLEIVRFYL